MESTELSRDERAIIVGIAADLAEILGDGRPVGCRDVVQKIRFGNAVDGIVKPDYADWLGYGAGGPALSMRASRTVARLERLGLLRRVREGDANRVTHLSLTDAGRELARQLMQGASRGD
jgi:hypothetical protein